MIPKQDRVHPRKPEDLVYKYRLDRLSGVNDIQQSSDGLLYRYVGNEKEYINPPMRIGVEYRTTERFNEYPVYVKVIDYGILSTGGGYINCPESANVVRWSGIIVDSSGAKWALPCHINNGESSEGFAEVGIGGGFIYHNVGAHFNGGKMQITLWYTKG